LRAALEQSDGRSVSSSCDATEKFRLLGEASIRARFCNQNIPQSQLLLQDSPPALTAERVSERGRLSTFLRFSKLKARFISRGLTSSADN
jgi:hypothetical protein